MTASQVDFVIRIFHHPPKTYFHNLLELFDKDLVVGENADLAGQHHGFVNDLFGRQAGMLGKGAGGRVPFLTAFSHANFWSTAAASSWKATAICWARARSASPSYR